MNVRREPVAEITFVIPTRDRPDMLVRAVRSITDLGHRVVVVDDGSIQAVEIHHPLVVVVRHPIALGVAHARNTGIAAVATPWIAFLDDDDETVARPEPTGPVTVYGVYRLLTYDTVADSFTPHVGAVTLQTELCPQFDPRYRASEDIDWWLRLAEQSPITQLPDPGFRTNAHSGIRHYGGVDARLESSYQLLDRHARYFDGHSRARAFRWARIAAMERRTHHPLRALFAATKAMIAKPSRRPLVALIRGD